MEVAAVDIFHVPCNHAKLANVFFFPRVWFWISCYCGCLVALGFSQDSLSLIGWCGVVVVLVRLVSEMEDALLVAYLEP